MPEVQLNPLEAGGSADLTDPDGYKKIAMTVVSLGAFMALASTAQATVAPAIQSAINRIPGVDAGGGSNQGLPLAGEL